MTRERREPPDIIREHELDWPHDRIEPDRKYLASILTDFYSVGAQMNPPWLGGAIATGLSGSSPPAASIAPCTGWALIATSTSANSGYRYHTDVYALRLAGGERIELNFVINLTTNLRLRFGFQNSNSATAPDYGTWIAISGTTLTGETIDGAGAATTASSYTISVDTVYRLEILLNSDATLATFTVYDKDGAVLWTDTLNTNIPVAEGEELGHGVIVYRSGAGVVDYLVYLDRMQFDCDREIVR